MYGLTVREKVAVVERWPLLLTSGGGVLTKNLGVGVLLDHKNPYLIQEQDT